jgi:hypothetical protein
MKFETTKRNCALLAGALFCTVGLLTAQGAASTIVTFSVDMGTNILNNTFVPGTDSISAHGTFDGWGAGITLVQEGSSTVYTNTVDNTHDTNGGVMTYKFVNSNPAFSSSSGYENLQDGKNRGVFLPTTSGASLVLPTPFYADSGAPTFVDTVTFQVDMAQQIALGNFNTSSGIIEVRGTLNGWAGVVGNLTNDPSIKRTNQFSLVTSNVYVGTFSETNSPYANMGYKFVENNGYEGDPVLSDGGNRFYTISNGTSRVLPIAFYNDSPFAPISTVTFNVDMSVVAVTDTNYNPASVTMNGDFNGWSTGLAMTNNPSSSNTNIYSVVMQIGEGANVNFQYRYTHLSDGSTVYDHLNGANGGNGNRLLNVPAVISYNVPVVVFNDASLNDYLLKPTPVFFSVDMTGAVGFGDGHTFDPNSDNVYINGQFANWYAWASGVNPAPAPSQDYKMVEEGVSMIYTNTLVIPAGTPVSFNYKYGIDIGSVNLGPADDEAASGLNHYRVVRSLGFNPYVLAQDKFGNQYGEPFFSSSSTGGGELTVGPASRSVDPPLKGTLPISWLGRPGAHLQVKTNLASSVWQDLPETDGTNWTSGHSSTNGFVSVTNVPVGSHAFFRLIKP